MSHARLLLLRATALARSPRMMIDRTVQKSLRKPFSIVKEQASEYIHGLTQLEDETRTGVQPLYPFPAPALQFVLLMNEMAVSRRNTGMQEAGAVISSVMNPSGVESRISISAETGWKRGASEWPAGFVSSCLLTRYIRQCRRGCDRDGNAKKQSS